MNKDFTQANYINLASADLGAEAIEASDDFFADKSRLIKTENPVWKEGVYDENGKWMDGWETRRKRSEGYDWCTIKLGLSGTIKGIDIDTSFFTGNFPPAASVQACYCPNGSPSETSEWIEILSAKSLVGDKNHLYSIESTNQFTHIRLNIYPDGGVARLRVYGIPSVDWQSITRNQTIDLASVRYGGRAILCSDEHFGRKSNLLNPWPGKNMGDGWETARRRTPGNDWVIVALGHKGIIESATIDTSYFKGNFPASASIQGACIDCCPESTLAAQSLFWQEILPQSPLEADSVHEFSQLNCSKPITHVRLNIFPDGGVSRLKLFGFKA